jgi:hypothetical protein
MVAGKVLSLRHLSWPTRSMAPKLQWSMKMIEDRFWVLGAGFWVSSKYPVTSTQHPSTIKNYQIFIIFALKYFIYYDY